MTKYGRARRESDLPQPDPQPHPHPDADRPTARIPYAQLRSLVLSIIEPPESTDDLVHEFESQPTTFRARVPPAHYLESSSDQEVAGHDDPEPGRVATLDALVAELRIANARIMSREPDVVAAVAMPPTSAQSTTAPTLRAQGSRAEQLMPPLPPDPQGSHAAPPPTARSSPLPTAPLSGAPGSRPRQPAMTAPPSAPPDGRPRHPVTTAPPSTRPGSRPGPRAMTAPLAIPPDGRPRQPATTPALGARGSRPGPTEPPRRAQGTRADQLIAPPRRAPAIRGEHPIVTASPHRSHTSHTDQPPRRAQTPAPRRAASRTEPTATPAPRRAPSRADRTGVTPPPRRACSTINEVNRDRPASGRR